MKSASKMGVPCCALLQKQDFVRKNRQLSSTAQQLCTPKSSWISGNKSIPPTFHWGDVLPRRKSDFPPPPLQPPLDLCKFLEVLSSRVVLRLDGQFNFSSLPPSPPPSISPPPLSFSSPSLCWVTWNIKHQLTLRSYPAIDTTNSTPVQLVFLHLLTQGQGKETWALS